MNWILIGSLLGSIVTSSHDTREACEGRAVVLREKGASARCIDANSGITVNYGTTSILPLLNNCVYNNGTPCK